MSNALISTYCIKYHSTHSTRWGVTVRLWFDTSGWNTSHNGLEDGSNGTVEHSTQWGVYRTVGTQRWGITVGVEVIVLLKLYFSDMYSYGIAGR